MMYFQESDLADLGMELISFYRNLYFKCKIMLNECLQDIVVTI